MEGVVVQTRMKYDDNHEMHLRALQFDIWDNLLIIRCSLQENQIVVLENIRKIRPKMKGKYRGILRDVSKTRGNQCLKCRQFVAM